jgi:hypothetical protein
LADSRSHTRPPTESANLRFGESIDEAVRLPADSIVEYELRSVIIRVSQDIRFALENETRGFDVFLRERFVDPV